MSELKLELCVGLTPDMNGCQDYIHASRAAKFAYSKHNGFVQIGSIENRLSIAPHLTLYQFPILIDKISVATKLLAEIARGFEVFTMTPTRYNFNKHEGSLEILYKNTPTLAKLQEKVLEALNPLRGGLLIEKDPGGNDVTSMVDSNEHVYKFGFGESLDKFKPHVTLNWFDEDVEGFEENNMPELLPTLNEVKFPNISIYIMGPNGTCVQNLFSADFN